MTLASTARHEAGHAVAMLWAFRTAPWLARRRPLLPVSYVEVYDDERGNCCGPRIYSTAWGCAAINERHRDLMTRQVIIDLAGGVAESLYLGKRGSDVLGYAMWRCGIDTDLKRAAGVMGHMTLVDGRRSTTLEFAEQAAGLLRRHWDCVDAVARALVRERRLEGHEVERIVDHA